MKQQTLTGFEKYGKTTRRAQFLADMDRIVPWSELTAVVDPVYPRSAAQTIEVFNHHGKRGDG
jgi:IS5 family transposase